MPEAASSDNQPAGVDVDVAVKKTGETLDTVNFCGAGKLPPAGAVKVRDCGVSVTRLCVATTERLTGIVTGAVAEFWNANTT